MYGVCPSGGFNALWSHYHQVNVTNFLNNITNPPYAVPLSESTYYYDVAGPGLQVPPQMAIGNVRSKNWAHPTYMVQSHAASIIFQQQMTADWWSVANNFSGNGASNVERYHYFSNLDSGTRTKVPAVAVQCSPAQNISANSTALEFPDNPLTDSLSRTVSVPGLNSTPSSHIRFSWYQMDPADWPGITAASYLELPWTLRNDSRVVVTCTIKARWLASEVHQGPTSGYAFYARDSIDPTCFSSDAITVDNSWLNAVNALTPTQGPGYIDWGPSTIESIITSSGIDPSVSSEKLSELEAYFEPGTQTEQWNNETYSGSGNKTTLLESIIASQFVDSMSRYGSHKAFNTAVITDQWPLWSYERSENYGYALVRGTGGRALERPPGTNTEMGVKITIEGYGYNASGVTDYLSMMVIFLHIILAVCHTLWVVGHAESSSSWDSIAELLALAQNSRPAHKALHNTGAGIKKSTSFARTARVRVTRIHDHAEVDHVELLFDEHEESHASELAQLTKQTHGSVPIPRTPQVQQATPGIPQPLDEPSHEAVTPVDVNSVPSSRAVSPLPIADIIPLLHVHRGLGQIDDGSSGGSTPVTSSYSYSSAAELVEKDVLYR